jgi:hypothetical protein
MSAADEIKNKLRDVIMNSQPQIIQIGAPVGLSNEAENELRASLFDFFNAASPPPMAMASAFSPASIISEPIPVQVFKYGSGDSDDIVGKGADEVDTDLFIKSRDPLRGYVLLMFSVSELFKKCERYTLMKSKVVDFQTQNQREHLANLIALTEDEFELFAEDFLYNAVVAVYNLLGVYGRDIGVRDMVFNPGTIASMGTIIYAVRVPKNGFYHNYVLKLYENIRSALYYSVLQQWAQWCNDAGEIEANGQKYGNRSEAILKFRDLGPQHIFRRPTRYY